MKLFTKFISLAMFGSLLLFAACSTEQSEQKGEERVKGIDSVNFDFTISQEDDFYQYANGGWMKNNPIPDDKSRYGAFDELVDKNNEQLKVLMEEAMSDSKDKSDVMAQIGDFYAAGMDEENIEKAGYTPIKEELAKIENLSEVSGILQTMIEYHALGMNPFFVFYSGQDEKNSEMVIANIWQGGLGLPDRDYYTSDDDRSKELRSEYAKHLQRMFKLIEYTEEEAKKASEAIMAIETRLATASLTRLECRDPHAIYHKMAVTDFDKTQTHIDWVAYLKGIGLEGVEELNVCQPNFFNELNAMMSEVSIEDWKTYLKWNLVHEAAAYLSSDFVNENFAFYGKVLSGAKELRPRWKRVLSATNGSLGEAVGKIYVEKFFPPEAKAEMDKLVANLKTALEDRIKKLDWMSEGTKKNALEKLGTMNVKIGYPDKFRDYSGIEVKRDNYFANIMAASKFNVAYELNKVGKPVDRGEWHMSPQTVNAYYSPNLNEIVFPAAILQAPFFTLGADQAVNYGSIGVVIGHEMTHGFDDQGRQYDKQGNLEDWWTEDDAAKFTERVDPLIHQYNDFEALDGFFVDGNLTLGENIADLGGITVSYQALKSALEEKPELDLIDGFTQDQRFFLAYAQVWRQNIRDEELKRRLKEDVHSPGKYRTNGAVVNFQPFYDAFGIGDGAKMYLPLEKRAAIW